MSMRQIIQQLWFQILLGVLIALMLLWIGQRLDYYALTRRDRKDREWLESQAREKDDNA